MDKTTRKPLFVRIARRGQRNLGALIQSAYLYLYAVPVLMLKGELAPRFSVARGHGSFLLLSDRGFLKIAISPATTLDQEYANYSRLREVRPDLVDVLPNYRLVEAVGLVALACERLSKISYTEALIPAVGVYERYHCNSPAGVQLELASCPQIISGLQCVEARFGGEIAHDMRVRAEAFLARGQYTTGLAHGDFHSRNIMRGESETCLAIDLDCVRMVGIVEFDALYFALEQVWSASGGLWTGTLADCFIQQGRNIASSMAAFAAVWSSGLGVAFFLDRIGQDFANYGMHYERRDLAMVIDAIRNADG